MEINSNRLRAFYQLARIRNFHKAAKSINISQSALSQRIMKLEQEMETPLVVRGDGGISLTDAGDKLFEFACDLFSMEQDTLATIKNSAAGALSGSLRLATYSSVLRSAVMPALQALIQQSSDIHVEFFSRELHELPAMLKTGEADFILLNFFMEGSNLNKHQIGTEYLVHAQNRQHSGEQQPFLDHDVDDMTTYHFFKHQNQQAKVIKRNYYDDIYGIVKGVQLGLGQAIVSSHLIRGMDEIQLVPHDTPVSTPVVLHYRSNRYLTQLHIAAIEHLQQRMDRFLTP
jgi:DNA-binding transcriptional LysR family regulator